MAGKNVKLTLALDKDKEFRDSLKACKDEVRRYKEDLKELTDGFGKNKRSMEDLQKVQEDLKGKQEAYRKQLDSAKTGLQHANEQYEKTNARLQELKEKLAAAEKAQDKLNDEGKEGTEEYKKATAEVEKYRKGVDEQAQIVAKAETNISKWTHEVKNAERGLEQCDKDIEDNAKDMRELAQQTDKAGDQMDDFADDTKDAAEQSGRLSVSITDMVKNKVIDLAGNALLELGRKALEAAKYIVEVGSEFEAQMSKVEAISGASKEEVEKLSAAAQEMGRTTKFTASEAGEALEYMAMAGWKTDEMLAGLSGVMDLAAASGTDLGTTSDIVTDALTAFGKSAEESGRLADVMAAASSNANTNVEMMGETFKYAAPVAGALGYSMEDTATAIGLMANSGIKASQAGTAIRTGLTRLVNPTKQAKEAMEQYGISVTDTDGNMLSFHDLMIQLRDKLGDLDEAEQAAAVSAIFGKNSMSGWLAVVNASDSDFDNLTNAINNSDGAAKNMAETMQDNLQGKVTLFNSAMQGLATTLYGYFSDTLSGVVEFATEVINKITDAITPQKTELDKFIESIKLSNEGVKQSIENAKSTVANAELEVAKLDGYQTFLTGVLNDCKEFNLITLDDGTKVIVDSAGNIVKDGFQKIYDAANNTDSKVRNFGKDGFSTDKIKSDSENATTYIGYVEEKARTTKDVVADLGSDQTSGALSGIVSGLGDLEISTQKVYHVTDEFTKVRITNIVNELKDTVPELAEAWDENAGTLDLTNQEIVKYIQNAKDLVRTEAYVSAQKQLLESLYEAEINAEMAQSALIAATEEYNSVQEEANELSQTGIMGQERAAQAMDKVKGSTEDASAEMEEAQELYDEANKQLELLRITAKRLGIDLDYVAESTEEGGKAAGEAKTALEQLEEQEDDTAEATEGLTEAQLESIKAFQDMSGSTIEDLQALQEKLGQSDEAFAKWCEDRVAEVQPIIDEYHNLVESIATELDNYVHELDATGEEGDASLEHLIENMQKRQDEVRQWGENMRILAGQIGKDFTQEMYDELAREGFEKSKETVAMLVQGFDSETGQLSEEAKLAAQTFADGLNDEQIIAEMVANSTTTGQKMAQATADGYVGEQQTVTDAAVDVVENATDAAIDAAGANSEVGERAVEEMAGATEEKGSAVSEASEAVVEAAQDAAYTAADKFEDVGRIGMLALSAGMNGMKDHVVERVQKILDSMNTTLDDNQSEVCQAGKDLTTAIANGMKEMAYEVDQAICDMVDSIKSELESAQYDIKTAGKEAGSSYAEGIGSMVSNAAQAGGNLASVAQNAASSWNNAFYNTGYFMSAGLADGIYSGRSRAMSAAEAVARSALQTAKNILGVRSPSKEFEMIGEMSDEGLAKGFNDNLDKVTSASQNAAYEALKAAQATLNDGTYETTASMVNHISLDSMRTLASIGNVGAGVADVGGMINNMRKDLLGSLADFQNAVSAQGNQRQHVILQVGSKQFDAYLVNTATNGLSAMQYNMKQGAGL